VKSLWAYAYQIVPPQPSGRLGTIRRLLREGTAAARSGARTWSGRLVLEREATHILIVSDDALGRDHPINRSLEAELERLQTTFFVTEPLVVVDRAAGVKWLADYDGNGHGNGA